MRLSRNSLIKYWTDWAAPTMIGAFIVLAIGLAFQQHAAYRTNLYDLGSYTHLVWNIANGRPFVTSLWPASYLTNHFSLALVFLAPVFLIWSDPRALMAVQQIIMATAVWPAYLIVRQRYPRLAPLLVLTFVTGPLLHQTSFAEFHGVMLAVPFLAWAVYALYQRRTWSLVVALVLALLAREDVGLYVASFGLFLLITRKGQRWLGAGLIVLGGIWVIAIINWVMPALGRAYNHFKVFSSLGGSMSEIILNLIREPAQLLNLIATPAKIRALLGFFLPLAGLPLLALDYALLWLPVMVVFLISNASGSGLFNSWRIAPFLPLIWGSLGVLAVRLSPRRATAMLGVLTVAGVIGSIVYSPFPGGGQFNPALYQVNAHTQIGDQIIARIPPDAYVAAQNNLAAHLAARSKIRLFPRYDLANGPDYILLDETADDRYPVSDEEYQSNLLNLDMNLNFQLFWEQDGYRVYQRSDRLVAASTSVSLTWDSTLRLDGFDLAAATAAGPFEAVTDKVGNSDRMRVSLYWTALDAMPEFYAISVRLIGPDGSIVAQNDAWPGRGALPTPLWEAGRSIRDVHYLDLTTVQLTQPLEVRVLVYDAGTLEPIGPAAGYPLTRLVPAS